jgi:hypothetical protein
MRHRPRGEDNDMLEAKMAEVSPFRAYIITVWWQDGWTFLWYADSVPDEAQIDAMRPGVRSLTCAARP